MLVLSACTAGKRPEVNPQPLPLPTTRERADFFFVQGKAQLETGNLEKARNYFNQSIDLLMTATAQDPSIQTLSRNYIDEIAALEMNFIRDRSETSTTAEAAFIDEVINTPLYSPSAEEVTILQQKVASPAATYAIPMVINNQVVSFINAFQSIKFLAIQRALNRSRYYIQPFTEVFARYQVPADLVFLPIIESGFRIGAVSRARAKGMWQFMASTARLFGLRVDWLVDERLDPYKAAEGAAKYLRHLYDQYGDWYLALACYNGGPRRVERAINSLQSRDFFELNQARIMRRETRNYVPAFLASLIIAKNPREYGFEISDDFGDEGVLSGFQIVSIPSPVRLSQVAQTLQIPVSDLKRLNPSLLNDFTPPHLSTYEIRIPENLEGNLLANLERIPPGKIPTHQYYMVRKGDTLSSISRKFRISVQNLRQTNSLRTNLIHPGQRLVIPRGG